MRDREREREKVVGEGDAEAMQALRSLKSQARAPGPQATSAGLPLLSALRLHRPQAKIT